MSIPTTFTTTDLDGQPRILPLVVNAAGYVTPLTPVSIMVLPLEQLRIELDRCRMRTSPSSADLQTEQLLAIRIREIEGQLDALTSELAAAKAAYAAVLDQLQPYTEALEQGTGWQQRATTVRHDQLLRKLELAQQRVWDAQDALKPFAA